MVTMVAGGTVRALIWVSGLVQGVAYRAFTQRTASQQGLHGGVRNLDDGRVAVDVEGERQAVECLIASLRIGPPMAQVQDVRVQWEPPTGRYHDFRIWP
jgi:acylphosphatase